MDDMDITKQTRERAISYHLTSVGWVQISNDRWVDPIERSNGVMGGV